MLLYRRMKKTMITQKLDGVAWRSKPSSYIVATKDRTVQHELQRFVAKRMGANRTEVASSHVPMLSHPDLVINVIRAAAKAVQGATAGSISFLGTELHARQPATSLARTSRFGLKPARTSIKSSTPTQTISTKFSTLRYRRGLARVG
jgi:hypothetical protein